VVGRQYRFGSREPIAAEPAVSDQTRRLAQSLCSADFKRHKASTVTLSFDSAVDRDAFWNVAHELREAAQRRG
jgi:hypothetical protein